jgi:hypothetical protein
MSWVASLLRAFQPTPVYLSKKSPRNDLPAALWSRHTKFAADPSRTATKTDRAFRTRRTKLSPRSEPALGRRHHIHRAIAVSLVYLAPILDSWSRSVLQYAIGDRIDARLALVFASRRPCRGSLSDRGSQASEEHTVLSSRSTRPSGPRHSL